jgi:hypothetical protein
MEIAGTNIHDKDFRFRMYAIVLAGVAAFGSILFWRTQTLLSADYQDFGVSRVEREHVDAAKKNVSNKLKMQTDISKDK